MANAHADPDARTPPDKCDRLRQLFVDVFGPGVLPELPLVLEALRSRRRAHAPIGWNRFDSARRPPCS